MCLVAVVRKEQINGSLAYGMKSSPSVDNCRLAQPNDASNENFGLVHNSEFYQYEQQQV